MTAASSPKARVTMFMAASPERVYEAFVQPDLLTKFWLEKASASLAVGRTVHWHFMVEGAEADATATVMDQGRRLAWHWGDESKVTIDFERLDNGTAVTIVNDGFAQKGDELVAAALDATEGFALVLADLKTLLESGTSAGITKAQAKLIALRK